MHSSRVGGKTIHPVLHVQQVPVDVVAYIFLGQFQRPRDRAAALLHGTHGKARPTAIVPRFAEDNGRLAYHQALPTVAAGHSDIDLGMRA
jgi:hypothetical protein